MESLLARGAGIAALLPLMGTAFSRRALYRHRSKHMIHAPSPAAHPVLFPKAASTLDRLKWLEQEVEHTAALAERQGDLRLKLKALHELARLIWLEARLSQGAPRQAAIDVTDLLPEPERSPEDAMRPCQGSPAIDLHGVFRRSELQGRNRE